MPSDFVPLLPRKPGSTAGGSSSGGPTPAFTPLRAHASAPCANPTADPAKEPVVTLQKDGERVTGIRIECACGQVIELTCTY